jgi:hypothetical protein
MMKEAAQLKELPGGGGRSMRKRERQLEGTAMGVR